MVMKFRTY